MNITEHDIKTIIEMHEDGSSIEQIEAALVDIKEEERIAEIDGKVAQAQCDTDWDAERYYESIGMSEYDLNPGTSYNDAGEWRGP